MGRWMCDEWRREEGGAVECISERRWGGGRWLWVWGGERGGDEGGEERGGEGGEKKKVVVGVVEERRKKRRW